MTGEDHNTDALIAALRSPALPAEQVGEAAVVTAMIEAQTHVPAASSGFRSRRGVAIAAVTVASLGLGGLAAAGPGIFSPAADQIESPRPVAPTQLPDDEQGDQLTDVADEADVVCVDGNHGQTVSSVADTGESGDVRTAARSDCGKPARGSGDESTDAEGAVEGDDDATGSADADTECIEANRGETVSSVARSTESEPGKGDTVSDSARADCDTSAEGSNEAPGQSGEAPGQTGDTPGQTGDTPGQSGDTPGQSGDTPGQSGDTPGQSGDTPGQTGDTPGQTGDTPGQSGDTPGQSGDTPGQTGDTPENGKPKP